MWVIPEVFDETMFYRIQMYISYNLSEEIVIINPVPVKMFLEQTAGAVICFIDTFRIRIKQM